MTLAPKLLRLRVSRFRGIVDLDWRPGPGLNLLLGGGDAGKSTLLDAISLLLSPVNPANLSDTEYYGRDIEAGFSIEAVMALPAASDVSTQMKPAWPWHWTGEEAVVPGLDDEGQDGGEPVYRVRVRGTEDLELVYEILQPDGTADSFPITLRRGIGLVRLGGDDRNDRDLRLVYGSALDRLLSDKGLRSRMASELTNAEIKDELGDAAKASLAGLDKAFREKSLPSGLDLKITGGQGASIASMVGLTADRDGMTLPLSSWGAGTRRLAALAIAEQNQGETPITVVDEIERGLEPYRQRVLVEKLQAGGTQVFVTTHSPASISAADTSTLWYVDHGGRVGEIKGAAAARHRARDPEMFLARLAVVAEGKTEQGFATGLLRRALRGPLEPHGVRVTDSGGHDDALALLEGLARSGLRFAGFADDEDRHSGRWAAVQDMLGPLLFRWKAGCTEEAVISAIADDQLEALITDPAEALTGRRLRSLAVRLGIESKDFASIRASAGTDLRGLIITAALGKAPDAADDEQKKIFRADAATWFKTRAGGYELEEKVFTLGAWPSLRAQLRPFGNAVREAIGLPALEGDQG